MAKKKKEEGLRYLQMPLPEASKKGKMTKISWTGINYRNTKDTGEISKELNISTDAAPYLIPSEKRTFITNLYAPTTGTTLIDIIGYGNSFVFCQAFNTQLTGEGTDEEIGFGTTADNSTNHYIVPKYSAEAMRKVYFYVYSSDNKPVKSNDFLVPKEDIGLPGGKIAHFGNFDNYINIANIDYGYTLIFPFAKRSQKFYKVVVVSTHFESVLDNGRYSSAANTIRQWLVDNATFDKETMYYFKCLAECEEVADAVKAEEPSFELPWKMYFGPDGYDNADYTTRNRELGDLDNWENQTEPFYPKTAEVTTMPGLKYVCVAKQRLFGINDSNVYASGYNDYANWNFDTADEYSAQNAWMSSTQSSDGGENTGIIEYSGSVYVFKKNSTLEITNTKNPFRLREVFYTGAIEQRGIQVVGSYLIFVSESGVMLYNGSSLKDISYNLNVEKFYSAISGTDGRKFYLYCKTDKRDKNLFVYDTYTGLWAEEDAENEIEGFFKKHDGMFAVINGDLYKLDTGDYSHDWFIETDLMCSNTIDIKHVGKIQMLADLAADSEISIYLLYDDEEFDPDSSHLVFRKINDKGRDIKMPIRVVPRKTANYGFKVRIEGYGYAKIYQMELVITGGGEKYVTQ